MTRLAVLLGVISSFSAVFSQTASPSSKTPVDKAALEQYIRHLFVWGPQITLRIEDPVASTVLPGFQELRALATSGQASQEVLFYLSSDGKHIVQGKIYDLTKNPFESDLNKIKTDLQPSFGTADAPVVLVIYSDFQCSFCKEEAKIVRKELAAAFPKEVRVYFKDFPLEAVHPWAKDAAIAGRCFFRQKPAAFWGYHDWIFENQGQITQENLKEKVSEWAKTAGLESIQLGSCIENRATASEVEQSILEARAMGINTTPTVFINGRRLVGQVPWPQLKELMQHEIEYAKSTAAKSAAK